MFNILVYYAMLIHLLIPSSRLNKFEKKAIAFRSSLSPWLIRDLVVITTVLVVVMKSSSVHSKMSEGIFRSTFQRFNQ